MRPPNSTRTYGQYCGLARALDIIGERWNLLIVRELLIRPARYSDLHAALPGIATNLLAERLRGLESAGVIRRSLEPGVRGVSYRLTSWGEELRGTVDSLVTWSAPLMASGPQHEETFRTHWLVVALRALMHDKRTETPTVVGVEVDGTLVAVRVDATGTHAMLDPDEYPATVFHGEPATVLGLASGQLTVQQAAEIGELRGDTLELAAVFSRG
ncbi:winged helix-turn-helix transcriptional regulator [Nocardia sp. NPDC056000]|uniref:winged helix-turn-helix transcriptional regulator n=1 Tax=Nocardia sp. NPDC056000 TaxID=3345674 RepID=UPI0035D75A02